jgi:hypothetical protein
MSVEKVFLRKCETYTVHRASDPIEIDISKLQKCDPPYNGTTNDELMEYLNEHVFGYDEWYTRNEGVYPDIEITGECLEIENEYFDSRVKGCNEWMELGVPNEKYTRNGGFQTSISNDE